MQWEQALFGEEDCLGRMTRLLASARSQLDLPQQEGQARVQQMRGHGLLEFLMAEVLLALSSAFQAVAQRSSSLRGRQQARNQDALEVMLAMSRVQCCQECQDVSDLMMALELLRRVCSRQMQRYLPPLQSLELAHLLRMEMLLVVLELVR